MVNDSLDLSGVITGKLTIYNSELEEFTKKIKFWKEELEQDQKALDKFVYA